MPLAFGLIGFVLILFWYFGVFCFQIITSFPRLAIGTALVGFVSYETGLLHWIAANPENTGAICGVLILIVLPIAVVIGLISSFVCRVKNN